MRKPCPSTICFKIDKENISIFSLILQQGFKINARVGCSLKSMLCDQFGVTPGYLSDRIQTIFLDGKPVDDPESTIIVDKATVALSAAMPGLVGATFRSGGSLSAFRSSITHKSEEEKDKISAEGMVTLKFFNLLVSEMGPGFLERGIWVKTDVIKTLIEEKTANGKAVFKSIIMDGQKTRLDRLGLLEWDDRPELIHVTVQLEK